MGSRKEVQTFRLNTPTGPITGTITNNETSENRTGPDVPPAAVDWLQALAGFAGPIGQVAVPILAALGGHEVGSRRERAKRKAQA